MNLQKWWREVPRETQPKLTFHNSPVSPGEFEKVLLDSVTRKDYVVIKLDIDTPDVEIRILDVVERHAHLVDELFFEYHFWLDGLDFGWGLKRKTPGIANVTTALHTMQRLRKKGIRAHFWV